MLAHSVEQARTDKQVYELGRQFLLDLDERITEQVLAPYLSVPDHDRPRSLSDVFLNLALSAQNRQSMPRVIGGAIGGVEKLSDILCGFQPQLVLDKYAGGGPEALLDEVVQHLLAHAPPRREARSHWPRYCSYLLSGAEFLAQFKDAEDFYAWVDFFDHDERARPALPALLRQEIRGFGFALACDFLKELGYHNFCKPDVHLKHIFTSLGLSSSDDDYSVFKAIVRLSRSAEVTPYDADKVFWLISSGRFYKDGFEIGRHRDKFIAFVTSRA